MDITTLETLFNNTLQRLSYDIKTHMVEEFETLSISNKIAIIDTIISETKNTLPDSTNVYSPFTPSLSGILMRSNDEKVCSYLLEQDVIHPSLLTDLLDSGNIPFWKYDLIADKIDPSLNIMDSEEEEEESEID